MNTPMNDMDEECESGSLFKFNKSYSQRECSINFIELAKMHLQEYQDIREDQFELVDEPENVNRSNMYQSCCNYMKPHTTFVPIGTNFQAEIPEIVSAGSYLMSASNSTNLEKLRRLKIHEPHSHSEFYSCYKGYMDSLFGGDRTYEEVSLLKRNVEQMESDTGQVIPVDKYMCLGKVSKTWQDLFQERDKELQRRLKKKKKKVNKGSMDI